MKKNRILITGGTGFIGYHLAKECLKLNWSVDSVSTKSPPKKRKLKKVQYLKFDISSENDRREDFYPSAALLHLGAILRANDFEPTILDFNNSKIHFHRERCLE